MRRRASSILPEHPTCVSVVDHYEGVILFGQFNDVGQGGDIAIHAEDPVRNDHSFLEALGALEDFFEGLHVLMGIDIPI